MIRIVALHNAPRDPEEYEKYYRGRHMQLVQVVPGVRNIRIGRSLGSLGDGEAPYYLMSEVFFDDRAALDRALESPEMARAMADVPNFAPDGVKIMICEGEDIPPMPRGEAPK